MMRPSPNNRRMRGRGNGGRRTGPSNSQHLDSNGPDLKVRGNATQIVDKYQALAREATTSGDPVMAENYYQHAEHYLRILGANAESRPDNNHQDNNRDDNQTAKNQGQDSQGGGHANEDDAGANGAGNYGADTSAGSSNGNGEQPVTVAADWTDDSEVEPPELDAETVESAVGELPEDSRNPADIAARASRPRRRRPRPQPTETGDAVS